MNPKAVLRVEKIKQFGNLAARSQHISRERETPNADDDRVYLNKTFIGTNSAEQDVRDHLEAKNITALRKDGVIALDYLLTASPEYFDTGSPKERHAKLASWIRATGQWLKNNYGDRLVNVTLHRDEKTPHIHATVVPSEYDQKRQRWKLNAKGVTGGRDKLSAMQDSYAAAVADLGIDRGIKRSIAKHTRVRDFYAAISTPAENVKQMSPEVAAQFAADQQRRAELAEHVVSNVRHAEQRISAAENNAKGVIFEQAMDVVRHADSMTAYLDDLAVELERKTPTPENVREVSQTLNRSADKLNDRASKYQPDPNGPGF